jgi:hypothetical protein
METPLRFFGKAAFNFSQSSTKFRDVSAWWRLHHNTVGKSKDACPHGTKSIVSSFG